MQQDTTPAHVQFHSDPACPLAWRTALWIREARKVRPIDITWRFFSLEVVNRKEGVTPDFQSSGSWLSHRTMALVRRQQGNDAVERLYFALGAARHGYGEDIRLLDVVRASLQRADLDPTLVDAALDDESTIQDVLDDHNEAVQRYRAFGVPTIAIDGSDVGFYGPIIQDVPRGEEAGELWDYTAWALRQPNLFELKRDRAAGHWGPVAE
ncbi:MAG TPA: DsbA family protein [Ktedonobacteraceae bacterium]|nr:DsbA family protein [Ktedonobacteraceae bacterium]